ncbi:hypothetical protein BpHYR1_008536 [Brachionus plicatilis]|uniref:Uncharacterized protein n=1 Tax=Brachionus plicatilis TaxID=10195 RepID=A0A3M7T4M4_BRAPC|nr:hypothetical protein BpHYR1_008536 [Brachionus plicatilis]
MTKNIDETLEEINQDITQFINYMKNSVYYASGLESFFKQELDKIALKFRIKENEQRLWQTCVMREIEKGNSDISYRKFDTFIEKEKLLIEKFKKIQEFHSNNNIQNANPTFKKGLKLKIPESGCKKRLPLKPGLVDMMPKLRH